MRTRTNPDPTQDGRQGPSNPSEPPVVSVHPSLERVRMIRSSLSDLPEVQLPAGLELRDYRAGDAERWREILASAETHLPISARSHARAFGSDEAETARRQLFLTAPDGAEVGTATAWFGSEPFGPEWGRVHWLALRPAWQGRGLARPLLVATLRRLRALGHERAYLVTETARRRAIGLYLALGFAPDIVSDQEVAIWRRVLASR